ncbi:MAG TPA: hypothetical protein VFE78_37005 [Gemmataceae bacterium]|jgi:hypothetical protein|nr:hypothetical protein [Gemmataceae bacterium]
MPNLVRRKAATLLALVGTVLVAGLLAAGGAARWRAEEARAQSPV